jgi:hypothetical protein
MPDHNAGVLGAIEMLDNVIAAAKGARLLLTSEAAPETRETLPWGDIGDVAAGPSLDLNANIVMQAINRDWCPEDAEALLDAISHAPGLEDSEKLRVAALRAGYWMRDAFSLPCSCAYVGWFYGKWGVWAGMGLHSVEH